MCPHFDTNYKTCSWFRQGGSLETIMLALFDALPSKFQRKHKKLSLILSKKKCLLFRIPNFLILPVSLHTPTFRCMVSESLRQNRRSD
jgi:hypothetical protein